MNTRTLIILAGGIFLLGGCDSKPPKVTYTVNDPKDPNTTWKSEKPLTYAEAISSGKCPLSLPDAATNIQYVNFYAGYTGFSTFIRFEAPVGVCRDHARKVLEAHNAGMGRTSPTLKVNVSASPFDQSMAKSLAQHAREGVEKVARAPWFDADAVRHGEIWGEHASSKPVILIDTNRGVFYYALSN